MGKRHFFKLIIFFGHLIYMTFLGHLIAGKIFVVSCDLIDQGSVGQEFHDPVGCRLHKLMVVGGEQNHAREFRC